MLLGIDWGQKHIGVALSDPAEKIASPFKTIKAGERGEPAKEILKIYQEKNIKKVVLGIPKSFDGKLYEKAEEVKNFAQRLRNKSNFNIKIEFENEVFTSKMTNGSHKKAACLILQSYLDRRDI